MCRKVMGGDVYAGLLLYRISYLWRTAKKKLERNHREWLANPRSEWQRSAGLTDSEMRNSALPRLKRHGWGIVQVHQWKLGDRNLLWISLDEDALRSAMSGPMAMPDDMFEAQQNRAGIFPPKSPKNAYRKPV